MKKLFVFAMTMLLGASLSFAQTGGPTKDPDKNDTKGKKHHHHKGGKKGKKGSGGTTTPPPK